MNKKQNKHTQFLSQAIQLEEGVHSSIMRNTAMMVCLVLLVFLGWASITNINEVARTSGEIRPLGHHQIVQHFEGGIVSKIFVKEGESVTQGQVLMTLNGAGSEDDLKRLERKNISLGIQEERLRALSENRSPNFSKYSKNEKHMLKDQRLFLDSISNAHKKERAIIHDQIKQKKHYIQTLNSEVDTAVKNADITHTILQKRQALYQKGYIAESQILTTQSQLNTLNGQISQIHTRISAVQSEIQEMRKRLSSIDARYAQNTHEQLNQILIEKSQNQDLIEKLKTRVSRLNIVAPTSGIVQKINMNTIGEVAASGATLFEIVPQDIDLIVEIKIPPHHIGHIKSGQNVNVKFSSFDFSRYGSVGGKLNYISPTTFSDNKGDRYYKGHINLVQNYVGENTRNAIVPGMTVMADIITGEKTILDYLLKPINQSMKTALSER